LQELDWLNWIKADRAGWVEVGECEKATVCGLYRRRAGDVAGASVAKASLDDDDDDGDR
jgi:hypothetical protein